MLRFSCSRAAAHGVVLAVVTFIALGSALAAAAPPRPPDQAVAEATPGTLQPAQLNLIVPTPQASRTQGADQTTLATAFNPHLGLPHWVRAVRDTTLWSSADADAVAVGSIQAGATALKPLTDFTDSRLQVYFAGDGADVAPEQAWVDIAAVEPAATPTWTSASTPERAGDAPPPNVSALYVAVVDDASGQLMYGEQPHVSVPQASTTKIATTIVALERAPDLARRVKVTVSASAMAARDGSSTLGIEPGRSVRLDTLLYGMMLPSGNDAAEQVALSLADSREQFIGWMNDEAVALGLNDTHFANPSGMDAAGHYSSAYDMAMLARYAMRNPMFRTLVSTSNYQGDGFPMHNLNRLLDLYPGADGVKIGYTDLAQKTIVASAMRDGHRVYVSLMHSADLVTDSIRMFDWVWDNYTWPQ